MILDGWRIRLREVLRRRQVDDEAAAELRTHLELDVAARRARGLSEAEARRQARIELGNATRVREILREARLGATLEELGRELIVAGRRIRRTPGQTGLTVLTVALGVAVCTALFTVIDAVLLAPLPYPEPDRLVRIYDRNVTLGLQRTGVASGNVEDWRRGASGLEALTAFYTMGRTLSSDQQAEVVLTAQVSTGFQEVSGVAPALGRWFTEGETRAAQFSSAAAPVSPDPVVVLSDGAWRRRFGGDPGVVGRTVTLERRAFRVVGVMPAGFDLPEAGVELWIPWDLTGDRPRDQHYLGALGRLGPGVSLAEAESELGGVAGALARRHPETNAGWDVEVVSLEADLLATTASVLWLLAAAVALVLVVAMANVALLTVLRTLARAPETSLRRALGATPVRAGRQQWLDALVPVGLGGVGGLGLAWLAFPALARIAPELPRLREVGLDGRAAAFALALTVLVAGAAGALPAWRAAREASVGRWRPGGDRTSAGPAQHRLRDGLVVAQVALAMVLLCGAGLLARSYVELRRFDPGFEAEGVLVAPVFLDSVAYPDGDASRSYYETLLTRLRALPGVVSAGAATTLPTSPLGPAFDRPVWPAALDQRVAVPAAVRMITPGYLETVGIEVRRGRGVDATDHADAPRVVVVSRTLAEQLWPGRSAVGEQLVIDYSSAGTYPYEVVGVTGDVRFGGPRSAPRAEIYLPHAQRPYLIMHVAMRTDGDARALAPGVRRVLREVDAEKPAYGLMPLVELLAATIHRDRQLLMGLAAFAIAAVLLATLGIYTVLSARVAERRAEIGVRLALGAPGGRIARWVAGQGLRLLGVGAVVGAGLAWPLARLLSATLFGVPVADPTVLVGVSAIGLVAGIVAVAGPAWRARRVEPAEVLRRAA